MKLFWRVYLCLFASALLAFAMADLNANRSLRRVYREQVAAELKSQAEWMASEIQVFFAGGNAEALDLRCKEFGRLTHVRMTAVLPDGQVIGDSASDPSAMGNHADRPEIAEALAGRIGQSERFSDTLRRTMAYLAVPVRRNGRIVAVVRTSMPLSDIDRTLHAAYREMGLGVLAAAALFAVLASYLVRQISRPLERMRQVAERLAGGDLHARVEMASGGAEMRSLARTLNLMAEQLGSRMKTITQQSAELKTVFFSMSEGVLAVDSKGRVLNLNSAAAVLLGVKAEWICGRTLEEDVRQPSLQKFIGGVLASGGDEEAEIVLSGVEDRFVRLHGTPLADASGRKIGVLVVLSDTTRLKRLEKMRQDFVANVSHELKTPITALRGCVETLSDPERKDRADDGHFIAMMGRQVERLWAIVGDLLSLSRLEHDEQNGRVLLESGPIREVLKRAAAAFAQMAEAKTIAIAVECSGELVAPINAALLEQAVGNLIDNAVKYSGEGTHVVVDAEADAEGIAIRVQDEGTGIEKRHLPRIFERFYRVDQARSRALGGTGLGLAIVKHIAQAHGGTVSVASTPGRGSVFTIRLPRRVIAPG